MGEIVKQVAVEAPAQEVYQYVVDPRNAPQFISSINSILSGPEGTPKKGDVWKAEATFFGQRRLLNLRLDDLVVGRAVRFVLDGEPQAVLVLKLTHDGDPRRTTVSLTLDVSGVPSILLNGLLGNLLSADMVRLKSNLE
ncbi:MAG: SRPBCC family protein [Chloroflexota bacterium]